MNETVNDGDSEQEVRDDNYIRGSIIITDIVSAAAVVVETVILESEIPCCRLWELFDNWWLNYGEFVFLSCN